MALTRDFKDTVRARVARDPKFRKALLREGIESMLAGDIATAKTILRDYINATIGFTELASATHIPSKSLMRMLGPAGNPRAENLFEVVSVLQRREGVRFRVKETPVPSGHLDGRRGLFSSMRTSAVALSQQRSPKFRTKFYRASTVNKS